MGFNSFKADYPKIMKSLLNDERFNLTTACSSGQCEISYQYKVQDIDLIFTDMMNLFQGSLNQFLEMMGTDVQKGEVNHNIINRQNL